MKRRYLKKEKLQKRLAHFARKHLNKPYKYGAKPWEAPRSFDCSGFIQYLYKRIKINLPRTTLEQAHFGKRIEPKKEKLEIGDLLFFKGRWGHYNPEFPGGIGHVAIYVGEGQIIKAEWNKNKKAGKVREMPLEKILKRKDLVVIKRIILNG